MISVIVPVYKVERYLEQCIASIVGQSYTDLEIILVDDGSPDNCGAICDAWAKKDDRIRVLHTPNGGLSAARNVGLAAARGEIISFVDSDDYIAPGMYAYLMKYIEDGADIAECDFCIVQTNDAPFSYNNFNACEKDSLQAMREHILDNSFRQIVWNKLYRCTCIRGLQFSEGKINEDEFWTYRAIGRAKKLVSTDAPLYAYRQQSGSIMHLAYSPRRLQALEAKEERLSYLKEHFPSLAPLALRNLWGTSMFQEQMCLMHLPPEEQRTAIAWIKGCRKRNPLTFKAFLEGSLKEKIWLILLRISSKGTCTLRNKLKIGL